MGFRNRAIKKNMDLNFVEDPAARKNFEVIQDNFVEIFKRLDKRRWAISTESTGLFLTSSTSFVTPPTLNVSLECTGKSPILVFMRQRADVVTPTSSNNGGILITGFPAIAAPIGFFNIVNVTQQRVVHGTVLGSGLTELSSLGFSSTSRLYLPPSSVLAFDDSPTAGNNQYEIQVGSASVSCEIALYDCDLVAVELL